jgi:hypothetical protein
MKTSEKYSIAQKKRFSHTSAWNKGKSKKEFPQLSASGVKGGNIPWNKGKKGLQIAWNKGKLYPQVSGENNVNWKGGVSKVAGYKTKLRRERTEKKATRKRPEQCEVCGSIGGICFDHDHQTGKFRGWICFRCNSALGLARDSIDLLLKLAEYLKNNK